MAMRARSSSRSIGTGAAGVQHLVIETPSRTTCRTSWTKSNGSRKKQCRRPESRVSYAEKTGGQLGSSSYRGRTYHQVNPRNDGP